MEPNTGRTLQPGATGEHREVITRVSKPGRIDIRTSHNVLNSSRLAMCVAGKNQMCAHRPGLRSVHKIWHDLSLHANHGEEEASKTAWVSFVVHPKTPSFL